MAYSLGSNEIVQCVESLQLPDADFTSCDTTGDKLAQLSSSLSKNGDSKEDVTTMKDSCTEPREELKVCVSCNKVAHLYCPNCEYSEERGMRLPIWYCGRACQQSSWVDHKKSCLHVARVKQLYRAARIVQSSFYCFREHLFDLKLTKIEVIGNEIHVHEGAYNERLTQEFPERLIPSPAVREAVLTHLSCNDAMFLAHSLFRTLFEGTYRNVEQWTVRLKNRKVNVVTASRKHGPIFDREYSHEVLKVTLKSGEIYIVDIAGAQYGYRQSVWPLQDFATQRLHKLQETSAFDGRETYEFVPEDSDQGELTDAVFTNNAVFAKLIETRSVGWLASREQSVVTALRSAKIKADAAEGHIADGLCSLVSSTIREASRTRTLSWLLQTPAVPRPRVNATSTSVGTAAGLIHFFKLNLQRCRESEGGDQRVGW